MCMPGPRSLLGVCMAGPRSLRGGGGCVHAWSQVSSGIGEGYFQGVDMFGRAGIPGGRYTYALPTPEMVPGIPTPLVLTPSGDHHNTYGWQAYWKAFSFCDNGMM